MGFVVKRPVKRWAWLVVLGIVMMASLPTVSRAAENPGPEAGAMTEGSKTTEKQKNLAVVVACNDLEGHACYRLAQISRRGRWRK